jgi:uncharacterized membrane protein
MFAIAAIVAASGLLAIDRAIGPDALGTLRFGGTAEGARSVLSTIAQSMLTFTGLVFSITMLVLQLASSQLSPRVTRTFLRDRKNQIVLGLFVATFVFTLVVLREVRTPVDGDAGFVPGISIWAAFALLLASVAAFIVYIDHMAHSIRAGSVIESIARETRDAIDRLYPTEIGTPGDATASALPDLGRADALLKADTAGVLVSVDDKRLLQVADAGDRVAQLVVTIGDFVPEGGPLFRLWGRWDRESEAALRRAVSLGTERTVEQDAAFGFRQLVDVATRALSPGTNDPTTAVQALDRLHDLLRRLATRVIPSPLREGTEGRLRLILQRPSFESYVRLAVDEIRLAGEAQLQVVRRVRAMLEDLIAVVPPDGRTVIEGELERLDRAVDRGFAEAADRLLAGRSAGTTPLSADPLSVQPPR